MDTGLDAADVDRLKKAIDKLSASSDRVANSRLTGGIHNSNKVEFGHVGIWICVTCVIVMFVSNFYENRTVTDMQRKYDRMQDYLNAIYMQAPHLKPKDA